MAKNIYSYLFKKKKRASFETLDAYEAFRDFIRYGFYRNRSDTLAEKYFKFASTALDQVKSGSVSPEKEVQNLNMKANDLVDAFKDIVNTAYPSTKSKGIHKTDLKFLNSVCKDFIPSLQNNDYNVRNFCKDFFIKGDLKGLFNRLDNIEGVGPKIAALYIRDMLFLYEKTPIATNSLKN